MQKHRGIVLSETESVIREYEASYLKNPKTEGYIIATNRRLIFTGSSKSLMGNSIVVRETKIEQVSGVISQISRGKNIGQIIFGLVAGIIGISFLFVGGFATLIGILGVALGAHQLYRAFFKSGVEMVLSILASGESNSAIQVSVEAKSGIFSRFGLGGNSAWMSIVASAPGRHTEQLISELGALVQDIQIMGDHAIEKWKNVDMVAVEVNNDKVTDINAAYNKVKEKSIVATSELKQHTNNYKEKLESKNSSSSLKEESVASVVCECGNAHADDEVYCFECGGKVIKENIFN